MSTKDFRAELLKIMPGYKWTVHRHEIYREGLMADGIQTSGFSRLSTLSVVRMETDMGPIYEAHLFGYGRKGERIHACKGATLAQALRGLQNHCETMVRLYESAVEALEKGRGK
jgi:hypothetical protein